LLPEFFSLSPSKYQSRVPEEIFLKKTDEGKGGREEHKKKKGIRSNPITLPSIMLYLPFYVIL